MHPHTRSNTSTNFSAKLFADTKTYTRVKNRAIASLGSLPRINSDRNSFNKDVEA